MTVSETFQLEVVLAAERARLVRFCERASGDHDVAEDLAQEVLLEAWRHRHRLYNPDGYAPWLWAITRNVCLRWQRTHTRELTQRASRDNDEAFGHVFLEDTLEDDSDIEIELERQELAHLLDQALGLLPAHTRTLLIEHYINEIPSPELATRLHTSEGAIRVKLHRGKLALRRVLETHMPEEATLYGLQTPSQDQWQATRIWCTCCGHYRLQGRFSGDDATLSLRCPGCTEPDTDSTHTPLPGTRRVRGYKAAFSRIQRWVDIGYGLNRPPGPLSCPSCGCSIPLQVGDVVGIPQVQGPDIHVFLLCSVCGWYAHSSLSGVALALPEARAFWRSYPRIRTHLAREITINGRPALITCFESLTSRAQLEVIMDRDPFRVMVVRRTPSM